MTPEEILALPSMPAACPSYPRGPYRFINREYLIITYETEPDAIRAMLPEPLEPDGSHTVSYEFMRMPDSSGFGDYTESGQYIPAMFNGEAVNFTVHMFLDDEPPISGGREVWGFPKKFGNPSLGIMHDTLTGKLEYAGERVALGTMGYKHENLLGGKTGQAHQEEMVKKLGKTTVNLKLIPAADGSVAIAQLVAYNMCEVNLKGAWKGPARLHLVPHVNAPVADLPVRRMLGGMHIIADLTLPYGRVVHDYLKK